MNIVVMNDNLFNYFNHIRNSKKITLKGFFYWMTFIILMALFINYKLFILNIIFMDIYIFLYYTFVHHF